MFKIKNVSLKVIYLYRSDSLEMVSIVPGEVIEVLDINEFINLEGVLDPSKNLMRLI